MVITVLFISRILDFIFKRYKPVQTRLHSERLHAPPPMPSSSDPMNFYCLNQKCCGIRIRISGFIRIQVSAGSFPKCRGFISLSASVILLSFVKAASDCCMRMLINLPRCPILQCWWKWNSHPESVSGTEHHRQFIDSSQYTRPNYNINF